MHSTGAAGTRRVSHHSGEELCLSFGESKAADGSNSIVSFQPDNVPGAQYGHRSTPSA
jgi:hypothetical protein